IGSTVELFRYEQPTSQADDSPVLATFVDVGTGKVNSSNQIEVEEKNAPGRVTETTFYFASPLYPTAKVSGRVVGIDGFPVSRALVPTRGQSVSSKSDGSFTLENIPVIKDNDTVTLEVSYMRPDRVVDRTQRVAVPVSANVTTALNVDLVLSGRLSP